MSDIAIITGASSGMGREFVKHIDKLGLEIWAIALGKKQLESLKKECQSKVRCFDWDLTKENSFVKYKTILKQEQPNVKWLINCSGFGKFGRHDEISIEDSAKMIDLNCKGYVKITEYALPFMHKGARIVMISSMAAFQPIPYIGIYGATKAFTLSYARALNYELKSKKISVTCICPFWTKTNFFKVATMPKVKQEVVSKYVVMYDPVKVIDKAYKDAIKRKQISIYGSTSKIQVGLVKLLPQRLVINTWIKQQKLNKKYKAK